MKWNGTEYRDWRKIAEAIRDGKTKSEVVEIYDEGECFLCGDLHCCDSPCPLVQCGSVFGDLTHFETVRCWMGQTYRNKPEIISREEALKSAKIIAEIIEGTVCI